MRRKTKPAVRATRDPERTRGRILSAALAEFAARGFAGARVDAIARRAQSNKRMIYHYFGSKQGLFREVLRRKITERRAVIEGSSGDPVENLPLRFTMMCRDLDWIRLLGWEAVQNTGDRVQEEKFRREGTARARARPPRTGRGSCGFRIRRAPSGAGQAFTGDVSGGFSPFHAADHGQIHP